MDMLRDDAAIARAGWAGLLQLLKAKGVITEAEAHQVILNAYGQAERRIAFAAGPAAHNAHPDETESGTCRQTTPDDV